MTVSRRSFLTGAASTVAIAASGGVGAVAGGVAGPVIVPNQILTVTASEILHEVWIALPGQPMRLVGVGTAGIADEMVRRALAGFTPEMLRTMDIVDMRPSKSRADELREIWRRWADNSDGETYITMGIDQAQGSELRARQPRHEIVFYDDEEGWAAEAMGVPYTPDTKRYVTETIAIEDHTGPSKIAPGRSGHPKSEGV